MLFQTEYRKVTKNSSHIADFSINKSDTDSEVLMYLIEDVYKNALTVKSKNIDNETLFKYYNNTY